MAKGDALRKDLQAVMKAVVSGTKKGVLLALPGIKLKSQELTPVDEGLLKASHYTDIEEVTNKKVVGVVGATQDYAVYVHENLQAKHTTGQAKFLTTALKDREQKTLQIIQAAVNKEIKSKT